MYLRGWVDADGWLGNPRQDGTTFWSTTTRYETLADDEGRQQHRTRSELLSFDLSNPRSPRVAGTAALPLEWSWLVKVEGGRAFLTAGPGLFTYDVTDPEQPLFESFHRTQGWVQDVVTGGGKAYLPSGYYGVQTIPLGSASGR